MKVTLEQVITVICGLIIVIAWNWIAIQFIEGWTL